MSDTAISPEPSATTATAKTRAGFFAGRRGQKRKEALLAYLLLLPAMVIIGIFGLFPLIFSAYQSTRAGLNNIVGRPDGFGQYVRAIDSLAYVLAFWLSFFFIVFAIRKIVAINRLAKSKDESPWVWLIPGAFIAFGLAQLLRFVFVFLPGLLEVGEKLKGIPGAERQALFFQFVGDAWRAEGVASTFWIGVGTIALGAVVFQLARRFAKPCYRDGEYVGGFTTAVLLGVLGVALAFVTYTEVQRAVAVAIEEGEPLTFATQVVTISAGFLLWLFSWLSWRYASSHSGNGIRWVAFTLLAIVLMVFGWVFIAELPAVIAEGNKDWWQALKITLFYVVLTLPLELFLGLAIAVLLYQDIKAKGLYRMIFFLPFITPAVGSAAVFKVLFSGNPSGAINTLLSQLGLGTMGWLNEASGVNELIADAAGLELPGWAAGPSLALVVAVIYGVWRYTGYNIVFFLAGLGNIDREMYEAASIDGAGRWQQFRNITVPLLSPITYFLTIFGIIGTFKAFNTIFVLRTDASLGTMDTVSLVIFDAFNRDTRYGYAAALGIILLIIILSATALFDRIAQGRVFYD